MEDHTLKEGWMVKSPDTIKHLHNPKKWQRKWFSLDSSGDLNFFDSDKSSKPSGLLHIWQCKLLFDPKSKSIQHLFCIGLDFSDYSAYLKAESAQTFNEWLELFKGFASKCELEEMPDTRKRHGTLESTQLAERTGSVSSVRSRHFTMGTQSKFQQKEGYMGKTGGNNKGWKDRYFVLAQGRLSYFKNEKGIQSTPVGSIDMFDCSGVTKTTVSTGKRSHGFDLHTPQRVYNLAVDNETEQMEWMDAIGHTMEVIASIQLSPGVVGEKRQSTSSDASLDKILEKAGEEDGEDQRESIATPQDHTSWEDSTEMAAKTSVTSLAQEDKDGVVQLLEAEVEALRSKVSSLEGDLRSSAAVNGQLQEQLVTERRSTENRVKGLEQEKHDLTSQVDQLEKVKEELETINDSIQTQLEEQQERTQDLEEEQIALKQELDETQTSTNSMEEELAETQTKLVEIEEVAKDLEAALRKRGDSEPPPELSSLRSLNLSYKAKMTEEQSGSLESSTTQEDTPEIAGLKNRISALEGERDALKHHMDEMQSSPAPPPVAPETPSTSTTTTHSEAQGSDTAERLVHEERLKWQLEVAKVRRELLDQLEGERRGWEGEREMMKKEVTRLGKELEEGKASRRQLATTQGELNKSQQRVGQVEGEVSSLSERVTQLLAEKEKALADLKTIRKTNRSMEKRLSENEELLVTVNHRSSVGSSTSSPVPPDDGSRLVEAERKVGELQTLLAKVEKERDDLRRQLEETHLPAKASMPPPPTFNFFSKTSATVGTSGQALGAQTQAPPTSALRNGWTSSIAAVDTPPPKPKKPPKEVVDQFSLSSNSPKPLRRPLSLAEGNDDLPPPSIRSRTMSMFQTFFARR